MCFAQCWIFSEDRKYFVKGFLISNNKTYIYKFEFDDHQPAKSLIGHTTFSLFCLFIYVKYVRFLPIN